MTSSKSIIEGSEADLFAYFDKIKNYNIYFPVYNVMPVLEKYNKFISKNLENKKKIKQ